MPFDFQNLRIETFPNVNDVPVAPTNTRGGNGSHLIAQFNYLVNAVQNALNNLQTSVPASINTSLQWKLVSSNYTANVNEKIVVIGNLVVSPPITISLPLTATIGDSISVIYDNPLVNVLISPVGKRFNGSFDQLEIKLNAVREEFKFIWIGDGGWFINYPDKLDITYPQPDS